MNKKKAWKKITREKTVRNFLQKFVLKPRKEETTTAPHEPQKKRERIKEEKRRKRDLAFHAVLSLSLSLSLSHPCSCQLYLRRRRERFPGKKTQNFCSQTEKLYLFLFIYFLLNLLVYFSLKKRQFFRRHSQ